jgi:hypothetical protein
MDIIEIIAAAQAPTPSGTVGRVTAQSVYLALVQAGYFNEVLPTQAPVTEPEPQNTDQELRDRVARIEKHLGL